VITENLAIVRHLVLATHGKGRGNVLSDIGRQHHRIRCPVSTIAQAARARAGTALN